MTYDLIQIVLTLVTMIADILVKVYGQYVRIINRNEKG